MGDRGRRAPYLRYGLSYRDVEELLTARELKQSDDSLEHVGTFFCDEGEKYLNDYFLSYLAQPEVILSGGRSGSLGEPIARRMP